MAKANSPIRIEESLMERARLKAQTQHRSAAQQVEFWAEVGSRVSEMIGIDAILDIKAGLVTLKTEKIPSVRVEPNALFEQLDISRENGRLADSIRDDFVGSVLYQSSKEYPGQLEAVWSNGTIEVGSFVDGQFHLYERS